MRASDRERRFERRDRDLSGCCPDKLWRAVEKELPASAYSGFVRAELERIAKDRASVEATPAESPAD